MGWPWLLRRSQEAFIRWLYDRLVLPALDCDVMSSAALVSQAIRRQANLAQSARRELLWH